MKRLLILFTMTIVFLGLYSFWLKLKTQNDTLLLWSLTQSERECARQIVATNDLVFVETEADNGFVAVGYLVGRKYHVSTFKVSSVGLCEIEFQQEVFDCYDEIQAWLCDEHEYKVRPKHVQSIELTGDQTPEVYIWYETPGPGIRSNAHYMFYQKQANGSYEVLLHLRLCLGLSTVTVDAEQQKIFAVDDLVCDMFHGPKEYLEYSLAGGTLKVLRDEIESEFSQER
jgi:hypothetical protein